MAGPFESILDNLGKRPGFAKGGSVIGRPRDPVLPAHSRVAKKLFNTPFQELSKDIRSKIRQGRLTEQSVLQGPTMERKTNTQKRLKAFIEDFKKEQGVMPTKQEIKRIGKFDHVTITNAQKENVIPKLREGRGEAAYAKVNQDLIKLHKNQSIKNLYQKGEVPTLSQVKKILKVDNQTAANRIGHLAEAYLGTRPVKEIPERFDKAKDVLEKADFKYDIRSSSERAITKSLGEQKPMSSARTSIQRDIGKVPYNVDEIAGVASSARRGTEPYGVFSQVIKENVNKFDKRTFDATKSKKEAVLQKAIEAGDKTAINKAVKDFNQFVSQSEKKLNEGVKTGEKKIRLFKASLDKPEQVIKNFEQLPENYQKAFQENYLKRGYSYEVPKDVKTIFQIQKDFKDPRILSDVSKRAARGDKRIYAKGILAPLVADYMLAERASKPTTAAESLADLVFLREPYENMKRSLVSSPEQNLANQRINFLKRVQNRLGDTSFIELGAMKDPEYKGPPSGYVEWAINKVQTPEQLDLLQSREQQYQDIKAKQVTPEDFQKDINRYAAWNQIPIVQKTKSLFAEPYTAAYDNPEEYSPGSPYEPQMLSTGGAVGLPPVSEDGFQTSDPKEAAKMIIKSMLSGPSGVESIPIYSGNNFTVEGGFGIGAEKPFDYGINFQRDGLGISGMINQGRRVFGIDYNPNENFSAGATFGGGKPSFGFNFRKEFANGGLTDTVPPERGPMPQGIASLFKRV